MRQLPKTLGFSLLVMLLVLTACGGGDSDDNEPNNPQPNPTNSTPAATLDPEGSGQGGNDNFDEADVPLPTDIVMKNNLTLLGSNYFVQDDRVYVMFVVRNDSNETIRNIRFNVTMVDEERLPLENFSFTSPYTNIPPGQVIVVGNNYFMDERWGPYYGGIAAAITADTDPVDEAFNAYFDPAAQASLVAGQNMVIGTATNVGPDPLILVTATFALYDVNDEVLAVIPAVPTTGLDAEGYWQPGVTISFESNIIAIEDNDLSAVDDVQLVTAGYVLDFED